MADVSQIVLKDANGNVIGTYDVKDTSVPHDSKSAASGGTTLSLVTTGEKATWNAKADTNTDKLVDLTDVNITTPLNGQPLVYNDTDSVYKNADSLSLYDSTGQTLRLRLLNNSIYVFKNSTVLSPGVSISINHQDSANANGTLMVNNSNGSPAVQLYADDGGTNGGGMVNVFTNSGQSKIRLHGSNGNIETSSVTTIGGDVTLGTSGSSDNDSGDVVWTYGNGREKARLWTDNTYTSAKGLNYRLYKEDGTQLTSGSIPLTSSVTDKLPLAGGTMTGSVTCATSGANLNWGNVTLYGGGSNGRNNSISIGDDVTIGDCNASGCFGMKSTGNNAGFRFFNSSGNSIGGLQSTNGTLQWINSSGTTYNVMPQTDDLSSSLSVSGNLQSVTKKLFKCTNVVELFMTGKVKTAIADNAVIFTVPTGYNPKVNDVGFTFFTGTDQYIPTGMKFGYFTWGGRDFHTLGALGVGTQVTVHITYLI